MTSRPLLSRILNPLAVGPAEMRTTVTATPDERDAIAKELGLVELRRLTAVLTATAGSGGRVTIDGRLDAELVQSCVVSLKPVAQTIIAEPIWRRFAPARTERAERSVEVEVEGEDPPDRCGDEGIDLGAVVLEQLVLSIDPYPRADDAELPASAGQDDEAGDSPFAVLKTLGQS